MIQTAQSVAMLILNNVEIFQTEKRRHLDYWKLSFRAIMRLSGHVGFIPDSFMNELDIELRQLNIAMFRVGVAEICFMRIDWTHSWIKFAGDRLVTEDPDAIDLGDAQG